MKSRALFNASLKEMKQGKCLPSSCPLFAGYLNAVLNSGQDPHTHITLYLLSRLRIILEPARLMRYSSCSSTLLTLGRRHGDGMIKSFWKLFVTLKNLLCFCLMPRL